MQINYSIYPLGETAFTIAFDAVIDESISNKVMALYHHLMQAMLAGIRDIIPSYHTITLVFDVVALKKKGLSILDEMAGIETLISTCNWQVEEHANTVTIPVCYDKSLGLDIEALAALKGISVEDVITLHTSTIYRVYAIGFLPGFTYMGKVNEVLATPRKQTPRTLVPKGAVGIAGEQTGIYPLCSPGGWNIIGQTPMLLFDADREVPVTLKMGDKVKFEPISLDDYHRLKATTDQRRENQLATCPGLAILKQGLADSVQDLGRYGHQELGINPTGAMDIVAAQIANFLVGNEANEAVIEMHFPAPVFQFQTDAIIALSGADFVAIVNDRLIPINTPVVVAKDAILRFTKMVSGARCYMAVGKGYTISPWLNSCSTNLKARAGGYYGRLLQKGDAIGLKQPRNFSSLLQNKDCSILPWQVSAINVYHNNSIIHIIEGNEHAFLCDASKEILLNASFSITNKSDRMGYRLHGLPLQLKQPRTLISTAVTRGTIQLLPDGELIILMADHQTIGGYPRVGHIAQADIPKLAQMQANQNLQFKMIGQQEAINKKELQQQYLLQIQNACTFKLQEFSVI